MKTVSKFEYAFIEGPLVTVRFDGAPLQLPDGENLAASLLAAGLGHIRRSPVSGAHRAPFCMMGACFECLVEIDGITRQACMVDVEDGLVIETVKTPGGV
ncbi:(2Fe-2S)-binding protein [Tritonibacter mobilis]|uniref:(2Fe-2S)-binding protein n=1 Tax=Tritonibacter mobilis TaxID=379347 RepID=UPI003A5C433B